MNFDIYKEMVKDSPMAHLHMKISEDKNGNITSTEVMDYNKAFERIIFEYNGESDKEIKQIIEDIKLSHKEKIFFDNVRKHKKHTIETYIDRVKRYFNIEAYYGGNNEFHFRFNKVSTKQNKMSSALKESPYLTWMKDRNGRYVDINQNYLNYLNITRDEMIGKTIYDFTTKEKGEEIFKLDEEVINQNKILINQGQLLIGDGYYEAVRWPWMNKDETMVLGTFGIAVDITEKTKLTERLENTEKQFLEIVNNLNDLIIIRDEKKALYINHAFEKIYKFKPDELYEDMDKWYEHWDEIEFDTEQKPFSYDKPDTSTIRLKKEGQEDIWIWCRFVPVFDEEGKVTKKIGVISDITEQKKMQLEIDKMKIDFFANLSHELRTPISLILSALQVLALKIEKLDDNETKEYLDKYLNIIGKNGARLLRLVNNLIDTTRLDSGCFDYSPKNSDIVRCIEDICTSVVEFVNINNLEIIFDCNVEEKIVAFDQDNMERIILNLLSNAIKFNKPNGKIEVVLKCEEEIKIIIKDTGIGIPEDKLETIFGRFEQVKNNFKREKEGSGIGLSLVKSLVEIHNGTISLKSKINEGSEFTITLPNILIENEIEDEVETLTQYQTVENRMNVEFSDIYT